MSMFDINSRCQEIYDTAFLKSEARPVIGITANYGEQTAKLAEGYYKQVLRAGGVPVIVPPLSDAQAMLNTLNTIDGLLLTGGADINPLYMGEEPQPQLGGINDERDLPELLITRLAYNRNMPILGICRGIQTLAVALGGKVAQDIGSTAVKHSQDAARHVPTHSVTVQSGSMLYEALHRNYVGLKSSEKQAEPTTHYVNSFHHQAVSDPGPHLMAVAHASDGIIEAVESSEEKAILGVQWHPECMEGVDSFKIFNWLIFEAGFYKNMLRFHQQHVTLDTHCDTPMFFPQGIDFSRRDDRILVDLPKMTDGGLAATIMVAYLPQKMKDNPAAVQPASTPFDYANGIFDRIESIVEANSSHLALARTPAHLSANLLSKKKSIMLGIENGLALEGKVANVEHFARRGVVYITLCHNGDNDLCDSAKGEHTHGGLSALGKEVVREMNRLGVMVDMSHASEQSFYDALEVSSQPIVCSHSSCRALCDHPRNLTDDQMRALAQKGGVCQVTAYPGFLRQDGQATIRDLIAHVNHAVEVMGIDHVGLGTDFDGDGGVPGLADASDAMNFTRQLLQQHYKEESLAKLWGGNFLRVMSQVQSKQ